MSSPPSMSPPSSPDTESPNLRRFIVPGLFLLACFGLLFYRQPKKTTKTPTYWAIQGAIFGTTYTVKLRAPQGTSLTQETLQKELHQAITAVDWQMSTYKKKSELSLFNAAKITTPVKASASLLKVVAAAQKVSQLSQGAFDVTIGPIVNAWGFGPKKRISPPSKEKIAAAQARVGYQKLVLDLKAQTLQKTVPNLYVDLSAIAKGYGVDVLAETLEKKAIKNYMAEVGGEVRARGVNAQGKAWRIGIEKPVDGPEQRVQIVVPLRNASMATSGNYRNYITVSGRRISHLIDARTAAPVSHGLASVSVIFDNCMMADALATALYVLGPTEGLRLANKHKWAVLFLVPKKKGFARIASKAFDALLSQTK